MLIRTELNRKPCRMLWNRQREVAAERVQPLQLMRRWIVSDLRARWSGQLQQPNAPSDRFRISSILNVDAHYTQLYSVSSLPVQLVSDSRGSDSIPLLLKFACDDIVASSSAFTDLNAKRIFSVRGDTTATRKMSPFLWGVELSWKSTQSWFRCCKTFNKTCHWR
jgi:hypothetical protein